jgi:hypothetical protein
MKKTILFLALTFLMQFGFSQTSFNLGLGVGHQFGLPGIRAGYNWKRFEGSINIGLFGRNKYQVFINYPGYVKSTTVQKFNYCLGGGISFRINKNEGLFPKGIFPKFPEMILNTFITYNCGYIFSHEVYNGNLFYNPYFLLSLSGNSEWIFNKHFKVRFGFGWAITPKDGRLFDNYFPTASFGGIYSLFSKP